MSDGEDTIIDAVNKTKNKEENRSTEHSLPVDALLQRAFDGIIAINSEQHIITFNKDAEQLFGYQANDLIGQKLDVLIPVRYVERHRENVAVFLQSGDLVRPMDGGLRTVFGRHKDGHDIPLEALICKSATTDSQSTTMSVYLRDISSHRRADIALQQQEAYFRALVEDSNDAIMLFNPDGSLQYISPSAEKVLGLDLETIKNNLDAYLHPDDVHIMDEAVKSTLATPSQTATISYRVRQKKGEWRWIEGLLKNQCHNPRVGAVVANNRDVTTHRAAELALRESREHYTNLLAATPVGVYEADQDGRCTFVNDKWCEMTGLGFDGSLGEGWIEGIYPEDREKVLSKWAAIKEEKRPGHLEFRLFKESGEITWVLGQAHAIHDDSGSIAGYTGTVTDITERITAEHALRESEARFRQLFHSVPNPISLTHLSDGRFLDVNDAFTESIGWSREEVIGKTSIEIGLWLNEAERKTMIDKIRAGETVRNAEIHLRIRTGEVRDYLASVDTMQLDGTPCLLVASTDVTKQLQAVSLTKRHNRLLNTLSAVNELLLQESDTQHLFEETCRVIVEKAGFHMAWIGIADLDRGTVTPIAEASVERGYLSKVTIRCDDSQWGQGPTGTAIRENRTILSVDTSTDPRYELWRETAREYGFRSSAAIPIREQDRVFGCLNIYSKYVNDFGPDELPLLERMSADLGFVHERLEMQKRLRQSEVQLKAILDHSPALISIKDSQGDIILANRQFEILNLPPPEQLIGKNIFDVFPQDVAEALWASDLTAQNAGIPIEAEETLNHRDGTTHTYLTIKFPVAVPDEAPFGICSISTDITEYKKSQKDLEESEHRLASFFSEAPAGLVLYDKDVRFIQINPTLARTGNLIPEALVGKRPSDVLPPPMAKFVEDSVRGVFASGEAKINEEVAGPVPAESGKVRYWMHTHFPVRDVEGRVHAVGGFVVETTVLKQAEEALKRLNQELEVRVNERTKALAAANAELESFAYSVSHDLRAPLRAIDGFSRILLEDYEDKFDAEGRQHLDRIIKAVHRMGALIDALLALSRLSRQELRPQHFSSGQLATMVREIIHEIEMENGTQDVDWQIAPLSPCYADLTLLRQVWSNLLHNAAKYSRYVEQPKVQIGMLDQGGEKIYYVRDNGVGFDMDYADKLFGVFQRLHRQDEFEGTGIGLATVKRIVSMLGGHVWAEGELDEGATFYFTLP